MSTITLPNIRVSSDLTLRVRLKDSGVAVDWSTLTGVKAAIYSDAQRALAGRCDVSIDADDHTLLVCEYEASRPQYLGINSVVVSANYFGEAKTYDKRAFTFVRWTEDQAGEEITIDDPDVDVEISVEDVSSSILDNAIGAAFNGADAAEEAAASAESAANAANAAAADANTAAGAANQAADRANAAGITNADASVDANVGVPFVDVSLENQELSLAFHNLKGETGATGPKGDKGEKGDKGDKGDTGPAPDAVMYTAQSLTDGQKAQARTNIGATVPEVFVAIYGTTTYAEIAAAIDGGKVVVVKRVIDEGTADEWVTFYGNLEELFGIYFFSCILFTLDGAATEIIAVDGTGWNSIGIEYLEDVARKVSSWSAVPNDSNYPSEKLVKDSLDRKQPTIDAQHKLDYSLLSNTPTIPAAQVPADWNATEGVSRILNKPTVPTQYAGSPTAGGFANKAVAIPFGEVVEGSTATALLATVDNFPETLTDGVCAYIRNNAVASASGFTLNINGTGAKPVYQTLADASRVSTVFNANSTYLFVYNSQRVEGGCWDLYYGYNSNDNTIGYNLRTNAMSLPVTSACYRYRLLFTSADGEHFVPANASSSTNATATRTTTQTPIDPFGSIRYYSYTTAVTSGKRPGATYLWEQYLLTLGYSFNRTGAALTLTAWKPVYIKCAPQTDGSAIIDADNPYVQDLPATADGKIYIYLGVATSETQVEMVFHHPVYYRDANGRKRIWTGEDISVS